MVFHGFPIPMNQATNAEKDCLGLQVSFDKVFGDGLGPNNHGSEKDQKPKPTRALF